MSIIKVEYNAMQEMDFEAWQQELGKVSQITAMTPWVVGQLWLYGKEEFPDRIKDALPPGYASDKLERTAKVCKAFPESKRIKSLSFEHHAAVLTDAVAAGDREEYLALAKYQGWTAKQLKDHIHPKLIDVDPRKKLTAKHKEFIASIQKEGADFQNMIKAEAGGQIFDIQLDAPVDDVVEVLKEWITTVLENR